MHRVFALLVAAIASIFTGAGFALPKEDEFFFNTEEDSFYYQVTESESDVHYKNLYDQVRGYEWGDAERCETTRRQDDTRQGEWPTMAELAGEGWSDAQNIFAPMLVSDKVSLTCDKSKAVFTVADDAKDDINICAPAAGEINTSHFACNYGSHMEYVIKQTNGTNFIVRIDGAKCWYCCAHKTVPTDGRYTATTKDSLKGKTMSAGDVLCVAKAGTTVTVEMVTTTNSEINN